MFSGTPLKYEPEGYGVGDTITVELNCDEACRPLVTRPLTLTITLNPNPTLTLVITLLRAL